MDQFFNGVLLGLSLSILVGPLLFALIQAALEQGLRAGMAVASGIWVSDFLFVGTTIIGISWIRSLTHWPYFESSLSVAGGLILLAIGAHTLLSKTFARREKTPKSTLKRTIPLFITGFLINTINPFTVFFWISAVTVFSGKPPDFVSYPQIFIAGILSTIVLTDTLKVAFAKKVSQWLTPAHILRARKISGFIMMVFGATLLLRMLF